MRQRWWEKEKTSTGEEGDNAKEGSGCACLCLGVDPGVLFNDSQIGHGVSLVQNGTTEAGETGKRERSQHYTLINLRWLCAYGPKLLPFEMRDCIFIQGQNESCKKKAREGRWACNGGEGEASEDG